MVNPLLEQVQRIKKVVLSRGGTVEAALLIVYAWAMDEYPKPTLSDYIDKALPDPNPPVAPSLRIAPSEDAQLSPLEPFYTGKIEFKEIADENNGRKYSGLSGYPQFKFKLALSSETIAGINNLLNSRDRAFFTSGLDAEYNFVHGNEIAWLSMYLPIDQQVSKLQDSQAYAMFVFDIYKTAEGPGVTHYLVRNGDPVHPIPHPTYLSSIEGATFRLSCPILCAEYEMTFVSEDSLVNPIQPALSSNHVG